MGIKKVPFAYEHPKKRTPGSSLPARQPIVSSDRPEHRHKEKKEEIDGSAANIEPTKTTIRLVARIPLKGALPLFDQMCASGLSERKAVLGLFKLGFPKLGQDLTNSKSSVEANYASHDTTVETTKTVPGTTMADLRQAIDPFGVMSDRAIGQRLGEAILWAAGQEEPHGGKR